MRPMHLNYDYRCKFRKNENMNLSYLRTFVEIADAGGIARAGGRLKLSQPAASRQVLALEADLGVQLFDRVGRRLRLTSEGEDLLRQGRRLLMDADSITARARALKSGQTGLLRVGATPQVIENTLAAFLGPYRRRHPGVDVHLVEDGGISLHGRLDNGDVRLAIISPNERFECKLLHPVYVVAMLSPKHRLSKCRRIEVSKLADEPLLLLNRTFGPRQWFDSACNVAQISPRVLLESASPQTIIALAREGHGIAVVPSTVVVTKGISVVPLVQRGTSIGLWLTIAWDRQRLLATYARQFVEELAVQCKLSYPNCGITRRAPALSRPRDTAS
jgi:LysR family cyn operon transcriptional activator